MIIERAFNSTDLQRVELMKAVDETALDSIATYLHERSRLVFSGHKRTILRSRLASRLSELELPDLLAYWKFLKQSKAEDNRLFDLVTTNETSFFRNPAQFEYLHDRIVPSFEQRTYPGQKSIRVLCAGCSTGEEPYSVAMTLQHALRYPESWHLDILAGDLSKSCLEVARKGFYELNRLDRLPADYRELYTDQRDDGAFIIDRIRKLVHFDHLNLNDLMRPANDDHSESSGNFDIIFCRNVMIYFSPACQQLLVETLYRMLKHGGYLFTGDAEPLHLFKHDFIPVEEAGCLIYQKMEIPADA